MTEPTLPIARPAGHEPATPTLVTTGLLYLVILDRVKTAISIPDETFERAERRARELGVSRSQLYSTAVQKWLDSHETRRLTEQIDQALGDVFDDENRDFLLRASAKLATHSQVE